MEQNGPGRLFICLILLYSQLPMFIVAPVFVKCYPVILYTCLVYLYNCVTILIIFKYIMVASHIGILVDVTIDLIENKDRLCLLLSPESST